MYVKTDQIRYTYIKRKTQIHLYTNTSSLLFPPLRSSLFSVTNMTETRTRNDTHTKRTSAYIWQHNHNGMDSQTQCTHAGTRVHPLFLSHTRTRVDTATLHTRTRTGNITPNETICYIENIREKKEERKRKPGETIRACGGMRSAKIQDEVYRVIRPIRNTLRTSVLCWIVMKSD